jgi:dipeptidyl-peptidase-4
MFRYPDVYATGVGRARAGHSLLRHDLPGAYCGLPKDHPEEWKQSSPVTFAAVERQSARRAWNGDDNVHYQGTEALINARRGEQAVFDVVVSKPVTSDLRRPGTQRHLFGLLTRYLND